MSYITTKIFSKLKYDDFINIRGIGLKTANFLNDINQTKIINSIDQLKMIIKDYNYKTTKKIRYNFSSCFQTETIILTKDKLIYKINFI